MQFETKDEQKIAKELFLLTSKPVMYVCNVDEASAVNGNKYVEMVREAVKDENAEILIVLRGSIMMKRANRNLELTSPQPCLLARSQAMA